LEGLRKTTKENMSGLKAFRLRTECVQDLLSAKQK
jgi:hypothetical protein